MPILCNRSERKSEKGQAIVENVGTSNFNKRKIFQRSKLLYTKHQWNEC